MDVFLTIKILDIEQLNAKPSQTRNLKSQATHQEMVILMIGIITKGIVSITIKNMDMILKIA